MIDQQNTNQDNTKYHSNHDMTTNQQTAIRIREERLKQNITQQAIADHLGIDISSYSRLENGTVEITLGVNTLLRAFKIFF